MIFLRDPASVRARLAVKSVLTEDGCLLWTGAKQSRGYATLNVSGEQVLAHRAAWLANVGEIPSETRLIGSCPHKHCVNVEHWRLERVGKRNVRSRDGLTHSQRQTLVWEGRGIDERRRIMRPHLEAQWLSFQRRHGHPELKPWLYKHERS